jgi:malate dehydrogenase (oxaloacetate-decarboxylating)
MTMAPSVSYSITARLEVASHGRAVSEITRAVEQAGGVVTALDVNSGNRGMLRVDVTCAATDTAHAESLVAAMAAIPGVTVHKVSDRTFLLHLGGKIEMRSKVPLRNRDDLSMAYTPGVARVSLALAAKPEDARRLTIKRNSVAVVTDGSAVLGLGNVGPYAALPVMEGKAALFKRFAGIDAWPICLDTQDVDQIVATVAAIAPGFGGINLEDISAPRCFEVEQRLRAMLDIPVFHDDQHGTAIVVLAALTNALRVVGKDLRDVKIVMAGAGAAGTAVLKLLLSAGGRNVISCDINGAVYQGRGDLNESLEWIAAHTNPGCYAGDLKGAVIGADVFIGVSAPNVIGGDDVKNMAPGAIVFALANPDPEVDPDEAREYAAVVATGRSDYPNQINNVLAFPGVFRGLLDAQSTTITDAMLVAAARALADVVPAEELGPDYIIPSVFHPDVASGVAAAVRDAALAEAARAEAARNLSWQRLRTAIMDGARHDPNQDDGHMDHTGSDPKAGRLLVATPILGDPNFKRAVVLIVEHEDIQGTLGVVLNRPTTIGVGQVLEQWTDLATEPSVVFRGGPVAPNSALALAMVPGKDEPLGWRALDGAPALARLGLLDLDTPPRLLAPAITSLRVYAGYSGWSPGQLEAEIDEGAWYVLTAQPGDVFAADPDRLWRQVLRRQDGDMAFLATYPEDPTQN